MRATARASSDRCRAASDHIVKAQRRRELETKEVLRPSSRHTTDACAADDASEVTAQRSICRRACDAARASSER